MATFPPPLNLASEVQGFANLLPAIWRNAPKASAQTSLMVKKALLNCNIAEDMNPQFLVPGKSYTITSLGNFPWSDVGDFYNGYSYSLGDTFLCTRPGPAGYTGTAASYSDTGGILPDAIWRSFNFNVPGAGPLATGQQLDIIGKYIGLSRNICPVVTGPSSFQMGDYNDPSPPGATGAGIPATPNNGSAVDFPNGMLSYSGVGVNGPIFASYISQGPSVVALTDYSYYLCLLIKCYTNTMSGSLYDVMNFLELGLIGTPLQGMITVTDGQNQLTPGPVMEVSYAVNVNFILQNAQGTATNATTNIILASILPRALGVGIGVSTYGVDDGRVLADDVTYRVLADGISYRIIQ